MLAEKQKGQMELMGIAIVVILVALGLLFAITIAFKKPKTATEIAQAKESAMAANFISTMRGTTTECKERTVEQLLQDCALGQTIVCDDGKASCETAKNIITKMLDETLKQWGKKYYFVVKEPAGTNLFEPITNTEDNQPCRGEREMKEVPMPVRPGYELKLRLELCR